MKRRNFIKLTASASAIGLFPGQITNALNISKQFINCDISNRKLVLIYLGGGNDGLNTIIPLNQYDLYSNLRPTLKIPESGSNALSILTPTYQMNSKLDYIHLYMDLKIYMTQGF